MHQLINKNKLYLYIFFFIFLSSIFNLKFLANYQEKFRLKEININGLPFSEKKKIEIGLNKFLDENIFNLSKDKILEDLSQFKYLEDIYVNKIMPSTINIDLSKTFILGKTFRDGEMFYIGKNRKYINSNQLSEISDMATVFGDFKIDDYFNLLNILNDNKLNIKNIKSFYYYKNKRWDLLFFDGITLMLPSKKLADAINIYKKILINQSLANVKIIDLRVSNQIILTNINE